MDTTRFGYSMDDLYAMTELVMAEARAAGASASETEVSLAFGQNVSVRKGEVETIEYNRDKGVGVTVYFGQRRGHASSADMSPAALRQTVQAACAIARHTAGDDAAGLADPALLAQSWPDLSLYHPWSLDVDAATDLARRCEAAALAVDTRISNSEGAGVSTAESLFVYANSNGFRGGYPISSHDISCAVIAESESGMQRDYWYTSGRCSDWLDSPETVGRQAGLRTVRRMDARRIKTTQAPVLFEASLAGGLIGHFVAAASGGSLYRQSSFLLNQLGQQVFAPHVNIEEDPHIIGGLASSPFDNEGVATHHRQVIRDGVLEGYFLSSYSARKLGMSSTGNAGGNHNLIMSSTGESFEELVRKMHTGLVVTELLGHGLNLVTGDYSRGAAGFWVENGEIQYPVEEITIAGNLKDMFRQIVAVGSDQLVRGSKRTGSILIERMTVAGE